MEKIKKITAVMLVTACLLAAVPASDVAQGQIPVAVSRGVDTADADKKSVLDLWTVYLNSSPGVMWSDQNWDEAKSQLWLDFDLTASFVFKYNDGRYVQWFKPTVLAIEKEGELYSIRTLFYTRGPDSASTDMNPWAIVRVYAQRVNGDWKLRSALGVQTEDWNRPAIGKITFVSPPSKSLDIRLARRAVAFCDSISDVFPFFEWDSFNFYITDRREDVDRIVGLEYHYNGYRWARALRAYDILITGKGSEWDPFELARMVATGPGLVPHRVVYDGFLGWVGGWNGKSYARNMPQTASNLAGDNAITFGDFLGGGYDFNIPGSQYFPGAVMCDMVFAAAGASGIESLFRAGSRDEDLYRAVQSTTGLGRTAFERAWRQRVLEFGR